MINRGFKFSPDTVQRVYPYRRMVISASIICIVLAVLVIINNVSSFGATSRTGIFFIILPHILAWALIILGIMGLKLGCLANSYGSVRGIVPLRPAGASIWMTSAPNGPTSVESILPSRGGPTEQMGAQDQPPPTYSQLQYPVGQSNQPSHAAWSMTNTSATTTAVSSTRNSAFAINYPTQQWQPGHFLPPPQVQEEQPPSYTEAICAVTNQQ